MIVTYRQTQQPPSTHNLNQPLLKLDPTIIYKKPNTTMIERYARMDAHALSCPTDTFKSVDDLVLWLLQPCETPNDRCRVLIRWITNNIGTMLDVVLG